MLVVAPRPGEQVDDLRAISAEHQNQRAAFYREFHAQFQIVEASDDFGEIARATMLFIIREEARRAVAVIGDFITCGLKLFHESSRTQGCGSFLAAQGKR